MNKLWKHHQQTIMIHHSPAKQHRDAIRAMHHRTQDNERRNRLSQIRSRSLQADPRQIEHMKLFGYYSDSEGINCYPAELCLVLHNAHDDSSLTYHPPEAFHDNVDRIGEVVVCKGRSYPALDLTEGVVLRSVNPRHMDKAIREFQ